MDVPGQYDVLGGAGRQFSMLVGETPPSTNGQRASRYTLCVHSALAGEPVEETGTSVVFDVCFASDPVQLDVMW